MMIDLGKYPAKWMGLSEINLENRMFQFRCKLEDPVLLASFKEKGQEIAIAVWVRLSGERVVAYGWKRVTAALAAGFDKVLVIEIPEAEHGYEEILNLRLDENLLKGNYDENDYIGIVADQAALGKTLRQIAERIRKSHTFASGCLMISRLPVEIVDGVKTGKVSITNALKIVGYKPASEAGETSCKPSLQPGDTPDAQSQIKAENTAKLVEILKSPDYKELIKNLIAGLAGGGAVKAKKLSEIPGLVDKMCGSAAKRNDFLSAKQQGNGVDAGLKPEAVGKDAGNEQQATDSGHDLSAYWVKPAGAGYGAKAEADAKAKGKAAEAESAKQIKAAQKDLKSKETELVQVEADTKSAEAAAASMEKSNADAGPLKRHIEDLKKRQEALNADIAALKVKLPANAGRKTKGEGRKGNDKPAANVASKSAKNPADPGLDLSVDSSSVAAELALPDSKGLKSKTAKPAFSAGKQASQLQDKADHSAQSDVSLFEKEGQGRFKNHQQIPLNPPLPKGETSKPTPDQLEQQKKKAEAFAKGDWKTAIEGQPPMVQIFMINGMITATTSLLARPNLPEEQRAQKTRELQELQAKLGELQNPAFCNPQSEFPGADSFLEGQTPEQLEAAIALWKQQQAGPEAGAEKKASLQLWIDRAQARLDALRNGPKPDTPEDPNKGQNEGSKS